MIYIYIPIYSCITKAELKYVNRNGRLKVHEYLRKHFPLRWRHNDHAGVSYHQPHGCLLNRLFRRKSKKTSKLRVTGLCAGNSPGTGEFPAQMASYAENVSIWWRHHALCGWHYCIYVEYIAAIQLHCMLYGAINANASEVNIWVSVLPF